VTILRKLAEWTGAAILGALAILAAILLWRRVPGRAGELAGEAAAENERRAREQAEAARLAAEQAARAAVAAADAQAQVEVDHAGSLADYARRRLGR
jgi:hypothetical protein